MDALFAEKENTEKLEVGAEDFVSRLKSLSKEEISALRKNAGNIIAESRGVPWFYKLLDDSSGEDDELYFLVATLYSLNEYEFKGDFGRSMAVLAARSSHDPVEHRFGALLESEFYSVDGYRISGADMFFRFRQLIKLAESYRVGIDWIQLIKDLKRWSEDGKSIQKKWAESFYAPNVVRLEEGLKE